LLDTREKFSFEKIYDENAVSAAAGKLSPDDSDKLE
jgi:hypothetical protein